MPSYEQAEHWQTHDVGTPRAVVKMMYGFGDSDKPLAETVSARGPLLSLSASLRSTLSPPPGPSEDAPSSPRLEQERGRVCERGETQGFGEERRG